LGNEIDIFTIFVPMLLIMPPSIRPKRILGQAICGAGVSR
jgi:hypothetical protein